LIARLCWYIALLYIIAKGTLFVNITKSNENKGTIWKRLT